MSLSRFTSRISKRLRPKRPAPVILMYHRVANVSPDPWNLAVSPARFEEQVHYLKHHRTALPLEEFAVRLKNGSLPQDAVSVTFDDGYLDNLIHAKPVLSRYGVPATLFLATGYLNSAKPFWWDELACMVLASTRAAHFELVCGNNVVLLHWEAGDEPDVPKTWQASSHPPTTARQKCFLTLWRTLKYLSAAKRESCMEALRGLLTPKSDPLSLPMTAEQIRSLLTGDLFSLGAHTVSHPALTSLSRVECQREISESWFQCRSLTPKEVTIFCYPYGDTNSEVRQDVISNGFSACCSTIASVIDTHEFDPFTLPRKLIPNCNLSSFARLLMN